MKLRAPRLAVRHLAVTRPLVPLLLAGCLGLFAEPAEAFRCGSRIVSEGDHTSKVRKFCGEPIGIQERVIYRAGRTRQRFGSDAPDDFLRDQEVVSYDRSYVEVVVEEWTYNFGPRKMMQLVTFENGFVTRIKAIGYGYIP